MLPRAVRKAYRCGDTRHAGTSRGRNGGHVQPRIGWESTGARARTHSGPTSQSTPGHPSSINSQRLQIKCHLSQVFAHVRDGKRDVTMPCSRYNAGVDQALSIFLRIVRRLLHTPRNIAHARGPVVAGHCLQKRNVLPRKCGKGGAAHVVLKVILCRANRVAHDLVRQIAPIRKAKRDVVPQKLQQIRRALGGAGEPPYPIAADSDTQLRKRPLIKRLYV